MKTILHVLRMNSYSGAENVVITMINGFRMIYPEQYRFVYTSPDGPIRQIVEENGIEFEPMFEFSRNEVKRIISKVKPDAIHAHDFAASVMSAFYSGKIPVISHIHNNSPWIRKVCKNSAIYGLSCFKYKAMLGVSPSVFDEFIFGKFFEKKEYVVGNPIDLSKVIQLAEEDKSAYGYDVVFLGRLSEQKKPLSFVHVIDEVRKVMPGIKTVMIGDGELRCEVEQEISRLNAKDCIQLMGFQKNPYGVLKASKILCMTSSWEGFGLVAVEALAFGKPVVATPVGGIPTIIRGKEGLLVTNEKEMAASITKILRDAELYSVMSAEALSRAKELDNLNYYVQEIASIYQWGL